LEVAVEQRTPEQVELHFIIRDTGIGIAPENQKLIFDEFSQADGSMTRKYGGTGLGLTISARLVEAMRGRIWVESVLGRGSSFHFTAWFGASQELTPAQDRHFPPGLPVLVVDDNFTNRRILTEVLRRWGLRAVSTASGAEALAEIRLAFEAKTPFGLIITDVHMPDMDGFEFADQLKQSPYAAGPVVLMLTSGERLGDIGRSRRAGVSNYMVKPVRREELRDAIARALGKQIASQENAGSHFPFPSSAPKQLPVSASRILLAEDNRVNQRLAQRILEKEGHQVIVVGNGREALEALENDTFDLILMDVQMPLMDGIEATKAIRKAEALTKAHIPIVALTAHAMKGDRDRCVAAGMDAYISKPIRAADLLNMVASCAKKEYVELPG
jgi:CheY-like chemotaxis protein